MKVTESEPEYKPITITLETKEEAQLFWHMLNCAMGESLYTYMDGTNTTCTAMTIFRKCMFAAYDKIWSK